MAYNLTGLIMIGGVIPWLKSLTNTPSIPTGFVECTGQTLSDAQSVLNGVVIPNLNGASSQAKRFLRGYTASGDVGGADSHTHERTGCAGQGNLILPECLHYCPMWHMSTETSLPPYYEVVYIMRVK